MIGIVSLVEHLHGRTSDYGIHVSGLMVEVALLFSVGVKDGIYRYLLLFLEQSQDGFAWFCRARQASPQRRRSLLVLLFRAF